MGKMNDKRKRNRQDFLRRLATKNEEKFHREWSKRLNSYKIDAARLAVAFRGADQRATLAFDVVGRASDELKAIGSPAVALDRASTCPTEMVLTDSCAGLIGRLVDPRLHKLQH